MTNTWVLSALWVGLALVATLFAIWFRVSTALSEIVVGTVAQLIIGALLAALVDHGQLALRRRALYHFSSSCLTNTRTRDPKSRRNEDGRNSKM